MPPGDDETWDEGLPDRRAREPLELRLSIQPARSRTSAAHREAAQRLLAELLELPGEERHRRLREDPSTTLICSTCCWKRATPRSPSTSAGP